MRLTALALLLTACAHVPCGPAGARRCSYGLTAIEMCGPDGRWSRVVDCTDMIPAGGCVEGGGEARCEAPER